MDLFTLAVVALLVATAAGAAVLAVALTAAEAMVWAVRRGTRSARCDQETGRVST